MVGTAAVAIATAVDPELVGWEPGKKAFGLPAQKMFEPGIQLHPQAFDKAMEGFSMRMVKQYHLQADQYPARMDVLMGYSVLRPDYAIKITDVAS